MREFSPLNGEEICRIIEVSAKAGVSEFLIDDMHFKFGQQPTPRAPDLMPQAEAPIYPVTVAEPTTLDAEKLAEEVRQEENAYRCEQLFDELTIIAPYLAEQLQANGEIKNEEPSGNGTEG